MLESRSAKWGGYLQALGARIEEQQRRSKGKHVVLATGLPGQRRSQWAGVALWQTAGEPSSALHLHREAASLTVVAASVLDSAGPSCLLHPPI